MICILNTAPSRLAPSLFRALLVAALFFVAPLASLLGQDPFAGSGDSSGGTLEPVEIAGLLREEFYYIDSNPGSNPPFDEDQALNILETRLVVEARRRGWRYYGDVRHYLYHGLAAQLYGPEELRIIRSMVRYTSNAAQMTFGKTYVNFGNPGLFNPFEIDKSVNLVDIGYARQGLVGGEFVYYWQDFASIKSYAGSSDPLADTPMMGISPTLHAGSYRIGAVLNRSGVDRNIAGGYFKGDTLLGWNGAWGVHFDDAGEPLRSEAALGLDYSFLQRFIFTLQYYYNETGAASLDDYGAQQTSDAFLKAQSYAFCDIQWLLNEFWGFGLSAFYNAVDGSAIILPSARSSITSGLSASLMAIIPTGSGREEFSKRASGRLTAVFRLEAKF